MKKILFIFLALAGVVACSSDDNSKEPEVERLIIQADKKEITVGESVVFKVSTKQQDDIKEVVLLCNNEKVSSPYTFNKEGKYTIVAKKKGFADSNVIEIVVKDKQKLALVITADKTTIGLNDQVTFTIKDTDGNIVSDAKVFNKTSEETLEGGVFHAKELGSFTFVAKADAYEDSKEITVNVNSVFTINGNQYALDVFIVSIEVETILDESDNEKKVDKVFFLNDGSPANAYTYYAISNEGDDLRLVALEVLVHNHTIKMNGREVIDYGKRILPGEVNIIELMTIIVINTDDFFINRDLGEGFNTLGNYSLKINELKVNNKGIGAGATGVMGFGDIIMEYENAENKIVLKQKGDLVFTEYDEEEAGNYDASMQFIKQIKKNKF